MWTGDALLCGWIFEIVLDMYVTCTDSGQWIIGDYLEVDTRIGDI